MYTLRNMYNVQTRIPPLHPKSMPHVPQYTRRLVRILNHIGQLLALRGLAARALLLARDGRSCLRLLISRRLAVLTVLTLVRKRLVGGMICFVLTLTTPT